MTSAEVASPHVVAESLAQPLDDNERTANTVGAEVAGTYGARAGAAVDPNVVTSGPTGSEAVLPSEDIGTADANAVAADSSEQLSPVGDASVARDVVTSTETDSGIASDPPAARWPVNETATFTPDESLNFVEDIEFAFEPETTDDDAADASRGWVQGNGTRDCPETFPIKGNGTSHIYHMPGQPSYSATIAELCFATEQDAMENGFRPTKRNRPSS